MPFKYQYYGATNTGRLRLHNEDNYGIFEVPNGLVMVVADGMGGHAGGKEASKMAVEVVFDYFRHKKYQTLRLAIQNVFQKANRLIIDYASKETRLKGMGSTLVLLIFDGVKIRYAHTGDSRLYHYSNHQLILRTKDHSVTQQLIDFGVLTPAEAVYHPQANRVTSALGVPNITVTSGEKPLKAKSGDIYMLCSDGLSNMVTEPVIAKVLDDTKLNIEQKTNLLIQKANKAGGVDNITVCLLEI